MISQGNQMKRGAASHRLDILKTFFYRAVQIFLLKEEEPMSLRDKEDCDKEQNFKEQKNKDQNVFEQKKNQVIQKKELNLGKETYWCAEYHKCHAFRSEDDVICIIYNSEIPSFAMRFLTQNTLKVFMADKQFCW